MVDTKETQAPLTVLIRDRIIDDTQLSQIVDRRVYDTWADKDSEFPYIVFRVESTFNNNGKIVNNSTMYIDLWDYNESQENILEMRGHIIRLFDEWKEKIEDITAVRFSIQTSGNVPENENNIWHHTMQFNARYDRKVEISQIIGR